jgi:hypothetical protein
MGATKNGLQDVQWDIHEQPQEEQRPIELSGEIAPDLFGIEPIKAQEMVSGLSTVFAEREILKNAYIDVIELPITSGNLPIFKELRLKIVKNRTQGIEKWHKTNKAFYLAGGRFVDAIKNKEVLENEQMESKLLEAEKFFENQEKEKKRLLNLERIERISEYVIDTTGLDFSEMSDYDFDDYVLGKKTRFENEAMEREAEALRIEVERLAEIEIQKDIEAENAKLKAEAEAKAILRNERSKLLHPYLVFIRDYNVLIDKEEIEFQKELSEIKIGAEQQWQFELDERNKKARQLFEEQEKQRKEFEKATEIRLKEEAIKKAREEKEKAEALAIAEAEKLTKAPVKEQLKKWVESFELPPFATENKTAEEIFDKFEAFKKWSITQINNL